jgi:tetratricopeptide (TPR) repeat protein
MGQIEEALTEFRRVRELDPLSPSIAVAANYPYYFAQPSMRKFDWAIEELQKIIAIEPNFFPAHGLLGWFYGRKGMFEQAIVEEKKALQLDGNTDNVAWLGYFYAISGGKAEALKALDELHERAKREFVGAFPVAVVYAGLGENNQALSWLQKAYENREEYMGMLNVDPKLDGLRSDPRFADLLRRMNLAP